MEGWNDAASFVETAPALVVQEHSTYDGIRGEDNTAHIISYEQVELAVLTHSWSATYVDVYVNTHNRLIDKLVYWCENHSINT